jgi:flavin-dependent dehydrogenase
MSDDPSAGDAMRMVRFTTNHGVYNGGETAGFADAEAQKYIDAGVAAEHELRTPATLQEIEAEVKAAGYSSKAAKQIAQDRFDGKYGEAGRLLSPNDADDDGPDDRPTDTEAEESGGEKEGTEQVSSAIDPRAEDHRASGDEGSEPGGESTSPAPTDGAAQAKPRKPKARS